MPKTELMMARVISPSEWDLIQEIRRGLRPISFLHVDDIKSEGFDTSGMNTQDISDFAAYMNHAHLESGTYWDDLRTIATERFNLPKFPERKDKS